MFVRQGDAQPCANAMGVEPALAEAAIRISLGWSTRAEDIDQLIDAWGALYFRTRASAA